MFVHISAVERSGLTTLKDGAKVTFDIEAGRDGHAKARSTFQSPELRPISY